MSSGDRYPYEVMKAFADSLWSYLAPVVRLHDVAGSVRRYSSDPNPPKHATCGDIELVLDADREAVMDYLRAKPDRCQDISGGERLVKFVLRHHARGKDVRIPVQLNFTRTLNTMWGTVNNYGWKYLLATGDYEWNQILVLERKFGGLKPAHIHKADGGPTSGFLHIDGEPLDTPTEQHVFDFYGIDFVQPHRRNAVTAREIRAQLIAQGVL
jgi:hypothetical protein